MEVNNDDSFDTICNGFSALSMANNATVQHNNNSMADLRAVIVAMQQQLSMLIRSRTVPALWGGAILPTVPTTYAPPHPLPPAQTPYAVPQAYSPLEYGAPSLYPAPPTALAPSAEGGRG